MPKIKCLLGPTTQYVLGSNYAFEREPNGDYTCMVFDEKAAECFLATGAYALADATASASPIAIEAATQPPAAPTVRTKKDATAEAKALGVVITQRMSLAEIDAAIADHQAKLAAEMLEMAAQPNEPALDPDGNPSDPTAQPLGGEEAEGESNGGDNSADSAAADPLASSEPDPDVSDND